VRRVGGGEGLDLEEYIVLDPRLKPLHIRRVEHAITAMALTRHIRMLFTRLTFDTSRSYHPDPHDKRNPPATPLSSSTQFFSPVLPFAIYLSHTKHNTLSQNPLQKQYSSKDSLPKGH